MLANAATESAARPFRLALVRGPVLELVAGRPLLMGVVNVTPDSFSDGGRYLEPDRAVEQALQLAADGARILDLGAESTRPGGGVYGAGAREVPAGEELDRLLPVLTRLRPLTNAAISVDTRKAEVASAALASGADLINDISGLADPALAATVRRAGCPLVLMHSRGELGTMQRDISFTDVVREVRDELTALAARAVNAGIDATNIVLDPGLGFGKRAGQNLDILRHLPELTDLGFPILIGASRKSFLGEITGAAPSERVPESLAAAAVATAGGARILRVHDVAVTRRFLDALDRLSAEPAR